MAVEKEGAPIADLAKKEYGYQSQRQKALVRCNHALSEAEIRATVETARTHVLPISAMGLVVSKGGLVPCITRDGLIWKLHNDTRELSGIETEVLQWASEENNYTAMVKCIVTMDGKPFVDYAQNSRAKEMDPEATAEDINLKCIDQALYRAGKLATGLTLPFYEDMLKEEDK